MSSWRLVVPWPLCVSCRRPFIPHPRGHQRGGHYRQAAAQQQVTPTTLAAHTEGTTRLLESNTPTYRMYGDDYTECRGKCIEGKCALRSDHPKCCTVRGTRIDNYPQAAEQRQADSPEPKATPQGFWAAHDLFCLEE